MFVIACAELWSGSYDVTDSYGSHGIEHAHYTKVRLCQLQVAMLVLGIYNIGAIELR
jgi:hypothetical protein